MLISGMKLKDNFVLGTAATLMLVSSGSAFAENSADITSETNNTETAKAVLQDKDFKELETRIEHLSLAERVIESWNSLVFEEKAETLADDPAALDCLDDIGPALMQATNEPSEANNEAMSNSLEAAQISCKPFM
jgi:hypothetical protein